MPTPSKLVQTENSMQNDSRRQQLKTRLAELKEDRQKKPRHFNAKQKFNDNPKLIGKGFKGTSGSYFSTFEGNAFVGKDRNGQSNKVIKLGNNR